MVVIRKILIIVLCLVLFTTLAFLICVDAYYWRNLPRTVEVQTSRVFQLVVSHGSIRYATQSEVDLLRNAKTLFSVGIFCGFLAGIINLKYKHF